MKYSELLDALRNSTSSDWRMLEDTNGFLYTEDLLLRIEVDDYSKDSSDRSQLPRMPWQGKVATKSNERYKWRIMYAGSLIQGVYLTEADFGERLAIWLPVADDVVERIAYDVARIANECDEGFDDYFQQAGLQIKEDNNPLLLF